MSRYWFQKQTANGDITVSYGYDHALGYFYQEESADGVLLTDLDSPFGGLTGVRLAERLCGGENALIACMAAATYPTGVNPQHVSAMMLTCRFSIVHPQILSARNGRFTFFLNQKGAFVSMFTQRVFNLVSRLIFSRWARGYEEHHGACEDAYAAFFGPLHLEINQCFVLDHDDAFISIRIPTPWGKLHLGYVICLGADEIRRPGFYSHWQKRLPKVVYGQACPPADDDYFPF